MYRVQTPDGWLSDPMPRAEAEELAELHRRSALLDETENPRIRQTPRHKRNARGESPHELLKRLEREVWG